MIVIKTPTTVITAVAIETPRDSMIAAARSKAPVLQHAEGQHLARGLLFEEVLRQLMDSLNNYAFGSEDGLKAQKNYRITQGLILHHFGSRRIYHFGGGGWAWRPRAGLWKYSPAFLVEPPTTDFDSAGHALEAARARERVAVAYTLVVIFAGVFPCDVIQTIHYCTFWDCR